MQSVTAFDFMQSFLAVLMSSPVPVRAVVLLERVSASVTPILVVEEVITLTNCSCTFWCKPGLRVRLHLVRAMWKAFIPI